MDKGNLLDSWKAISAYLGRDVRTCRRWELELGMPVHRLDGTPRARIFAYRDEIDRWFDQRLSEREPGVAAGKTSGLRKSLDFALIALGVTAVAFLLWRFVIGPRGGPLSIAVLPFTDLSPDKDQAAWCEGLAETISNALSGVEGMQVLNPYSTSRYSPQDDPRRVGEELNANRLIIGSLQRLEDSFRIVVKLINARSGILLWSDKYDRKMKDIFLVQDEIARQVLAALKVRRADEPGTPLVKAGTGDLEAYEFVLLGRHFWRQRGWDNLRKSMGYFGQAIAIDPKYAMAYVGLADAYAILGDNLYLAPREAFPKAKELVVKAQAIDDELVDAVSTRAFIKIDFDWDFMGAEEDFKKAIDRNPSDALARHRYGALLSVLGRHEEALAEIKLARELDPLAPRIRAAVGHFLYFARNHDLAMAELLKARDFDPTHGATYLFLGSVYRELGRYEDSVDQLQTGLGIDPGFYRLKAALAITRARAGEADGSRRLLEELMFRSRTEYVSATLLAAVQAALGEKDLAFGLLERALIERDTHLVRLSTDPIFDPLRSDPRFVALLKKVGL